MVFNSMGNGMGAYEINEKNVECSYYLGMYDDYIYLCKGCGNISESPYNKLTLSYWLTSIE